MKYLVTTILCLFLSSQVFGNDVKNLGSWTVIALNKNVKSNWDFNASIHLRNDGAFHDFNQFMFQGFVGYRIDKNNSFNIGYTNTSAVVEIGEEEERLRSVEHRLHQAFITRHSISRVNVMHRYMAEQRFLDGDFKLRLRYLLDLGVPLNNPEITAKTVYFLAENEIFLNSQQEIFNSNRFFTGFGYRINSMLNIELGYLHIANSGFKNNNINTIISFNF